MVSIEDANGNGVHDLHLASRKAEEAALRRYQAAYWLECFVGPLRIPGQPSESEFVSCLRNGLILCNAINKIHPGAVPKVVERQYLPAESLTWDSNALPAYQYFENVKNFLAAVEQLKVPSFQASDLEGEDFESRSVCRVVDCILALKAYHELKEYYRGSRVPPKPLKSPLVLHSASKNFSRMANANHASPCRRLDLSVVDDKSSVEDAIAKALVDRMLETKENINYGLLTSLRDRDLDPVHQFRRILTDCLEGQLQINIPEINLRSENGLNEGSCTVAQSSSVLKDLLTTPSAKNLGHCSLKKHHPEPWKLLRKQEKELVEIKVSLSITKNEFDDLNFQFFNDLKQIGNLVQDMSTAALGYQKVVQENRNLYNMVQDLKGNIRVYCRIRPIFDLEAKSVIDFIGEDGSLVLVDPSKPRNRRQVYQFNQVFGPMASQDELLRDIRPLIRSVLDGYNVCIFAYGQTGSGKTYTMSGCSDGSIEAKGMNHLALKDLFYLSAQRNNLVNYGIHVEMVEIYNERVRDLLARELLNTSDIESRVNSDGQGNPEATLHFVESIEDANNLIQRGEYTRAISSAANIDSSRSHSVLTIHVHGEDESGNSIQGSLHLVDLAGSERIDKSEQVDKSLSCLQDVITAISQKSSYIPYRNSKLTLLLQDALGGSAKTLMFAHINPEEDNLEETLSTVKFAQKVSTVELGTTSSNKQNTEVMELKQQIENLKKALLSKEGHSVHSSRRPTSPSEKPKVAYEKTPQPRRSRRMSIENTSSTKFQTTPNARENKSKEPKSPTQRSVRRSRRLSIENSKIEVKPLQNKKTDQGKERKLKPLQNKETDQGKERKLPYSGGIESSQKSPYSHSAMKSEKVMLEKTLPPRSRRLSIETPTSIRPARVHNLQAGKGPKSPYGGKQGRIEQTPPRSQRLGIENSTSVKSTKETRGKMNKTPVSRAQHGTVRASTRARRLSLEGPRTNANDDPHMEFIEVECDTSPPEVSSVSISTARFSLPDSTSELSHETLIRTPSSYQEAAALAEFEMLQQHNTPNRQILGRKEAQLNTDNSSQEYQTPSATMTSARVKESQIKKSLRSLGKLINGSVKRNHHITEASAMGRNVRGEMESSAAHPSTLRRQSLTGTLPSRPENLRRSSLGGKSTDTNVGVPRNSKTPPSHRSLAVKKEWM